MPTLLETTVSQIQPLDPNLAERAQQRLDRLTKPPGSLGRLEELARRYVAITGRIVPRIGRKAVVIFDGGIEAIDPRTNTVEAGFVIDEATIGGDITHFQIVSATKGFAIVTDASFNNALVSFDPTTGQKLATLLGPSSAFLPHFAINSLGELYLALAGATTPTQGVKIFNTVTNADLTALPLNVGLPPNFVLFIE